jgi:hypothetical protein
MGSSSWMSSRCVLAGPFCFILRWPRVLGYKARLLTALHKAHAMLPHEHATAASSQRSMQTEQEVFHKVRGMLAQ